MHRYFGNSILGDVSGAFSGFLLHEKQFSAYLSTAGEGGGINPRISWSVYLTQVFRANRNCQSRVLIYRIIEYPRMVRVNF